MSTRATVTLMRLADGWEDLYDTAQLSGVVGDLAHAQRGGYHISITDQSNPQNYSVVRADDKAPPGDWPRDCAAAIDMNLGLVDMKRCHARLVTSWKNRGDDPRARYINAHNGWNGDGNAGRYDWVTGSVVSATDDHKWHVHLEIRRRYVNDPKAADAILSILAGETVTEYLEADMALSVEDKAWMAGQFTKAATAVWNEVFFGRDDNRRSTGQLLVDSRTFSAAAIGRINDVDEQIDVYAAADAARDAALPAEVAQALVAGQSPEQVAEALKQVKGVDWAAVAPFLEQ